VSKVYAWRALFLPSRVVTSRSLHIAAYTSELHMFPFMILRMWNVFALG